MRLFWTSFSYEVTFYLHEKQVYNIKSLLYGDSKKLPFDSTGIKCMKRLIM